MAGDGVAVSAALQRSTLFEGLGADELRAVASRLRPRSFEAGEELCRAEAPGRSLFLIVDGFARVLVDADGRDGRDVARLRRGEIAGEMSLVTGEPQSATVVAGVATRTLELRERDFAALLSEHQQLLRNLTRILSRKLAATTARVGVDRPRGEAVALLIGASATVPASELLSAAEAASPRPVTSLDARESLAEPLAALDDLLAANGTVLVLADAADPQLALLVDSVDRTVAVVTDPGELEPGLAAHEQRVDVLVPDGSPEEIAWIGRHLARTKLGLALGAGGAKGYAHVGAVQVLEEAGYTVDYLAGSSIGAIIGAWLGLGMNSAEVERTMRQAFRPEVVSEIFRLSFSGASTGLETMTTVLRETTDDKSFSDLVRPLAVMAVDLNGRCPAPMTDGPLWQALLAATALAGIFPPYERDGERLVDGLALVPVPTDSLVEAGADVTVAVNIISREMLPAWPGEEPPGPDEEQRARSRMLDTLLEVMDLAQTDSSERHAARADIVITPRFGPSTWRDFHLADLFLEAGRLAADEQLPALRTLARPQLSTLTT